MRRATRTLLALGLLAALPAPAPALDWQGRLGLDYQRLDAPDTAVPRLDLTAGLDVAGATPGLLSWDAGVAYRRLATSYNGQDDVRNELDYRLRSSLFPDPRSPVGVEVHASRIELDGRVQEVPARTSTTSSYGGQFRLRPANRPSLTAGYTYTGLSVDDLVLGPYTRSIDTINAAVSQGARGYTYNARYLGNLSDGTFELDNYDDHRVDVDAEADVTSTGKFRISDTLYLRKPTVFSGFNPRLEYNTLSANLRFHEDDSPDDQWGTYLYSHGIDTVAGAVDDERTQHLLSYVMNRGVVLPEWRIRANADVGYNEERRGDVTVRSAGETVGGLLIWRRTTGARTTELHGGPSLGLLHPDVGSPRFGWGLRGGGILNGDVSFFRATALYEAFYETDLHGVEGWVIRQTASGSLDSPLGLARVRGTLQFTADRRSLALLGDASLRSVTFISSVYWRKAEVQLQLGIQDGVQGTITGVSDGLFLPPAFDSHSRYVTAGGWTSPWRYLVFRAHARYTSSDLPDRPSVAETELFGGAEFVYGALRLALENRYVIADTSTGQARYNQVYVRAYRVFGSRY